MLPHLVYLLKTYLITRMSAVEWHITKLFYINFGLRYFILWRNNLFSNFHASPELEWPTPNPIRKKICPGKSSISILVLPNSSVVDFFHLTRDGNWNPELLLWRASFAFSKSIFFWEDTDVIFAKFGFHTRASQISSPLFFCDCHSSI